MLISIDKSQRAILWIGLALSAVLLVKFAIDFSAGMSLLLASPFWILVLVTLVIGFLNLYGTASAEGPGGASRRSQLLRRRSTAWA
jgi:hypothetical protein